MKLSSAVRRLACFAMLVLSPAAHAHVGSKDVFEETQAGPYKLFVTVRPPLVIPGVAQVEVRVSGGPLDALTVTQLPLTGEASQHPPAPDLMKRSLPDPNFYTGNVWMMQAGSMQVRFDARSPNGHFPAAVPVPAQPLTTLKMQRALGFGLAACGILLIVGMGGIMGAAVRESTLVPGASPTPSLRRRGLLVACLTVAVSLVFVWGGARWWKIEAASFAGKVYKPLSMVTSLTGDHLQLLVGNHKADREDQSRANNDFILDHGKIMHLYAIREPQMDQVFHLHPDLAGPGEFHLALPAMPPGEYKLYGDVVHANGFPETLLATLTVPAGMQGGPLKADDAWGSPAPLASGLLPDSCKLPDGYTMGWDKPATLTASTAYAFHFQLLDAAGKPATHMRTYMGMAGHAAFVKTDGTVFAHVHPEGSAAMAAMMIANGDRSATAAGMSSDMPGMNMTADTDLTSNAVEFPYGFPTPGRYRIFVQMKHAATVETGTFDAVVK